jgi:hypothetical protein
MRRIEVSALQAFRAKVNDTWPAKATRLANTKALAVEGVVSHVIENEKQLLCQGSDRPQPADCSRIVKWDDFVAYNFDRPAAGLSYPCETAKVVQRLEKRGLHGLARGTMKGRLPVAWVTKTSELNKLRKSTEPTMFADRVRDALGLIQYKEDEVLVEIVYPTGQPPALHAPTFLEGDGVLVYRSLRGPDSWGRTVDLATMQEGLPEAVHGEVDFTPAFKIRAVGRLCERGACRFAELTHWHGCSTCKRHRGCEIKGHVDTLAGLGKPGLSSGGRKRRRGSPS